ncbi:site-2 protease family protein [Nannocystaceae bacterium ST9]
MSWAWRIATIAGIDVRIHVTFLALLAWIAWSAYSTTGTWAGALDGVVMILLVFTIVVMHEFGHALMARRFGVKTRDITLLPIGGVASLERMPERPRDELLVAIAGPAVNVVLAAILATIAAILGLDLLPASPVEPVSMLVRLVWINVALAVFNLLPAFPMDGGRALRALLAMKLSDRAATRIAAQLGQAMAILFAIVGLFFNPMLMFIALFLWMGASGEAKLAEAKWVAHGVPVASAMAREVVAVPVAATLAFALERTLDGFQRDFPVVGEGQVVGVLTREAILRALATSGPDTPVIEVMKRGPRLLHPRDNLEDAFMKILADNEPAPVVDDQGRLVGMLTSDSLGEFLLVRTALEQSRQHAAEARLSPS